MAESSLRAARRLYRERAGGRSSGDVTFAVYAAVMLAAIVAFPLVRAAAIGLAQPDVLDALRASTAVDVTQLVAGTLLAGALLLGTVRGPVLLSPFFAVAVAANGLERRTTLRRPFMTSAVLLSVGLAAVSTLLGSVLTVAAPLGGLPAFAVALAFVAGTALTGCIAAVCWLLGQSLEAGRARFLALAIAALTILTTAVPGARTVFPWGWLAALYPAAGGSSFGWPLLALGLLCLVALVSLTTVPRQLNRVRGPELLRQAQRWQTVGELGVTGDLATALGQFRARPALGRSWNAVTGGPFALTFFLRDLIGALRTPGRFATAALGTIASGALFALVFSAPDAVGWLPAVAAALLGFLSLGVWSDGFRHAVVAASSPTLYGFSTARMLLLHGMLPVSCALVFSLLGAVVVVLATGCGAAALIPALASPLFLVAVRLFDAAKGPLPLALLAPMPTPAGDVSAIAVAVWQADALIISTIVAGAAVGASATGGPLALLWLVPATGAILALARRRLAH